MIEACSIYKQFEGKSVLDDINATFNNGITNLIIGQSGAGKTVFLKCIVGLLAPDKGKIIYDGRCVTTLKEKEKIAIRREIGMLFQSAALFDSMSVLENVMFPLDMFSNMTYKERLARARACLDRVNLIEAQDKLPEEISGGMQKRAAIARAIALEPKYLFCDEPNSGLDPQTSIVIDNLIHDITVEYNITTIINTHDMNSVMEIGDKIVYIHQGKKWWEGSKEEILHAENKELNDFVFASAMAKRAKKSL
jgi:phospholipid/cholesterol/gamma-HCH transport system ATP-binding protein